MNLTIQFTESWTRTRTMELPDQYLVDFYGRPGPFTQVEVIEYLEEHVSSADVPWTAGMPPPSPDVPGDEFEEIDIWHVTGPDLAPPAEFLGSRRVTNVVDGL